MLWMCFTTTRRQQAHAHQQRLFHRPSAFFVLLAVLLQVWSFSSTASGALDDTITLNIPKDTSLEDALIDWGTKAGVTVMINTPTVDGHLTEGIRGTWSARAALVTILKGSGLSYTEDGGRIRVVLAERLVRSGLREHGLREDVTAPTASTAPSADDNHSSEKKSAESSISEVVVTAEKREENLQDVPIPMSVIGGETLKETNQLRLADYFTQIPGLTVTPALGTQNVVIRGLSQLGGNPTVGILVDDVPFGGSTTTGGNFIPNFDPAEISRIEVLRGPQGTLYGASTEGGLIKYVTTEPSLTGLAGRIEAGTSTVHNGAQLGYNLRGMLNVPLSDELAIRVGAFTRLDPGWVDNPVRGVEGINQERVSGGRLAALWRPSDALSVKFSALIQDESAGGVSDVNYSVNGYTGPPLGDLQQNYIPNAGKFEHELQAYSATTTAKIGSSQLTSITAYNLVTNKNSFDFTYAFGTAITQPNFGVTGTFTPAQATTGKFVQELRLDTPIGDQFDLLTGLFYTHESANPASESIFAEDPVTGAIVANEIAFNEPEAYEEYSAFVNLTYHITDRLQIQIGGREAHMRQSLAEVDTGPLAIDFDGGPSPFVFPVIRTTDNAFTYLFTPEFKISTDSMVYARIASGFRPSGLNESVSVNPTVPESFRPDKTRNYEIGTKGDAFEHLLSYDASVYDIEWTDIQLGFTANGFSYTGNGGGARSKGVELSVAVRPITGLTISSWGNWNRANLTDTLPLNSSIYGLSGDRLAFVPVFSGNVSVRQEILLTGDLTGSVGANVSYQGNRVGPFQPPNPQGPPPLRQYFPAFAQTNLNAGVTYRKWKSTFFINNVMDKRGLINGGLGYVPPYGFVYIQPRTIGLSVSREY